MSKWMLTMLLAALLFTLGGCGESATPPPTPAQPDVVGRSITVATTYGPNDGGRAMFEQLTAEFAEQTGVEIVDNSADSTEEWKQSILAAYEQGTEPDVLFFFSGTDVEQLIAANKFVPLSEIQAAYPDYAANINLPVLEGMKAADGQVYAVPVKGYWERIFVNTDIFDELKLPLPTEYGDLLELAPRLREAGYIPIAASLAEVPHYLFEYLLFNFTGPANHHNIPTDPANPSERWLFALDQFRTLYEAEMFPSEEEAPTHAAAFELFQSKRAAMIVDGDWSAPYVRDTEHVAVINFPAIPGGTRKTTDLISGFSMGYYISRQAWDDPDKREAAVAFVQFLTTNDAIMRINVTGAAMPIAAGGDPVSSDEDATPLRRSIDALNQEATAFVGAAADETPIAARSWLFAQILPMAKGEIESREVLSEFITINNDAK